MNKKLILEIKKFEYVPTSIIHCLNRRMDGVWTVIHTSIYHSLSQ